MAAAVAAAAATTTTVATATMPSWCTRPFDTLPCHRGTLSVTRSCERLPLNSKRLYRNTANHGMLLLLLLLLLSLLVQRGCEALRGSGALCLESHGRNQPTKHLYSLAMIVHGGSLLLRETGSLRERFCQFDPAERGRQYSGSPQTSGLMSTCAARRQMLGRFSNRVFVTCHLCRGI